ncbi:hypothetical protein FLJC2902T_22800 [Flavobacterium limnosediminis JC2902]|uniref:Uncharacterized protein n=1 Tax=Flavobacterium limnosediminis JC2902 TaxID=1341181 RepID=V6SR84_9FLAO|nr:hypothetical protein FLJC2902T_22800 [Flavobacterium limnosediminis JC2902]
MNCLFGFLKLYFINCTILLFLFQNTETQLKSPEIIGALNYLILIFSL